MDSGPTDEFVLAIGTGPILPMAHSRMVQAITVVSAKEISFTAFMDRIQMVFHSGSPLAVAAVNDVIPPSRC